MSSRHQKTDSQEAEIKKWLDGNGIAADQVEWYKDKESGKTLDRPAFQQLQKDIFNGTIKVVVCWKLDRLSRRLRDGVNLLADWCERGLKVVVVTQQIELNGPVGRVEVGLPAVVDEPLLLHEGQKPVVLFAGEAVATASRISKSNRSSTTPKNPNAGGIIPPGRRARASAGTPARSGRHRRCWRSNGRWRGGPFWPRTGWGRQ